MEQQVLTRKQTADKFNVCVNTLLNWEKAGYIDPPVRIGRRVYFTDKIISKALNQSINQGVPQPS